MALHDTERHSIHSRYGHDVATKQVNVTVDAIIRTVFAKDPGKIDSILHWVPNALTGNHVRAECPYLRFIIERPRRVDEEIEAVLQAIHCTVHLGEPSFRAAAIQATHNMETAHHSAICFLIADVRTK